VPGVESLNLVFGRNFDVADERLAFIAERSSRDVLYVHDLEHQRVPAAKPDPARPGGIISKLKVGPRREFHLGQHGVLAAFSPSISPDAREVAFTGLTADGTRDIFVLTVESGKVRRLTTDAFTERQLHWGRSGILFTSDATEQRHFNLFRINPSGKRSVERITSERRDQTDPIELPGGRILFTAFNNGRRDLYEVVGEQMLRRTDMVTGLSDTSPGPDGNVWALLYRGGRKHPVQLDAEHLAPRETLAMAPTDGLPLLERTTLDADLPYRPFALENLELGPIFGFGGAAPGGIYGQLYGSATDKLRNHAALFQLAVYGNLDLADGLLYYFNQEHQLTWGGGLFQSLRLRTDRTSPGVPFVHYERFYGLRAIARHPLDRFFFIEGSIAGGGTRYFVTDATREVLANPSFRSELGLDPTFTDYYQRWRDRVGGDRLQGQAVVRLGYDTLRYDPMSGPLEGSSVLLELTGDWQPTQNLGFSNLRLDAAHYFHLINRISLLAQVGSGTTFGGYYALDYFLSSYDTLRGVPFGDERFLVGRNYAYSTLELQVPLNQVIAALFLSNIEGVLAVDFGGVGENPHDAWNHRVLDFVAGFNFGVGPLVLRLQFARPIDIGAPAGTPAPGWVTNFTMGVLGMPGFFRQQDGGPSRALSESRTALPWR
jgi:hypothetical protein